MRKAILAVFVAALSAGCTQIDENPKWAPAADYPEWAYDAPFYYRPSEDLQPQETIEPGVPVYYTNSEYFFIQHPGGSQVNSEPRLGIWSSSEEGKNWQTSGYFGVEQSHFMFAAPDDGRYWIRFVGPSQGVSEVPPGMPHRIYVVDRKQPEIIITVDPAPYGEEEVISEVAWEFYNDHRKQYQPISTNTVMQMSEKVRNEWIQQGKLRKAVVYKKTKKPGQKIPHIYHVGDNVTVSWSVADQYLKDGTIKLGTCFSEFPHNVVWSSLPQALPPSGDMVIEIPPEAIRDGGMRFRMEATDKAGNVGMSLTEVMHVVDDRPAHLRAQTQPATQPAGLFQPQGTARVFTDKSRPGWPLAGQLIRGGVSSVLEWMPPTAAEYKSLKLQFSANDGRSWQTVASELVYGQPVKWSIPVITAKTCRLRIVGVSEDGREIMLAMTQRFIVDTATPDTIIGPKPVREYIESRQDMPQE